MKIAMVSIPYHATPPKGYGGIERVVYELAEELVRIGHEVVLFGAPGSYCSGETVEVMAYDPSIAPSGITKGTSGLSEEPLYEAMVAYLAAHPVDVIHDWSFENLYVLRHPKRFPFVISSCIPPLKGIRRPNLVAASEAHARLFDPPAEVVHYGLQMDRYEVGLEKTEPMIHIAKIAPYKGQHLAIGAAVLARKPLTIAGNVEDRRYFHVLMKPLIAMAPGVRYVGELHGVNRHLVKACALVQTPRWFDVFPLVILEALASGTPVIALRRGGIAEQIEDGANGFLCRNVMDLVRAMKRVETLDPRRCRRIAEERFSVALMAQKYCHLYERVIAGESW